MKILLLSDTHLSRASSLPDALVEQLRDASLILHAGDIVSGEVLHRLHEFAVTQAVHGNQDEDALVEQLPPSLTVAVGEHCIGLIHGHRDKGIEQRYREPELDYDSEAITEFYDYLQVQLPEADIIAFGHFHQPVIREYQGCLLVNPGSADPHEPRRSFAVLEATGGKLEARIVPF